MVSTDKKRQYSWYKHHAWAALALLSIFFALSRFVDNIPRFISLPAVAILSIYALVAIVFTYLHNRDNVIKESEMKMHKEIVEKNQAIKENAKIEKKRLKAQIKVAKKTKR
ncbi:MAG: hypothetical protein ACXQTP_06965 [Candidatus Methanofastidiosia archaeon]